MPDHNRKPLSSSGLTISKQQRTLYPTQLGVRRNSAYWTVEYEAPRQFAEPRLFIFPNPTEHNDHKIAHDRWEAHQAAFKIVKPLKAKPGDYAWEWQPNRDMNEHNVGLLTKDLQHPYPERLVLHKGELKAGVGDDRLFIRITKKQYLEVLQRTKGRKVMRRMGIVK